MTRTKKFGILWSGLALALCASPLQAATLIARYQLDETSGTTAADSAPDAIDHSGKLNGFSFSGSSNWSPTGGVFGGALEFDGSNDYVQLERITTDGSSSPVQQVPALSLSQWTLATWFKITGPGVTISSGGGGVSAVPLIAKGVGESESATADHNYFFGITPSGFLAADFEDANGGANNNPLTGTTAIPTDGEWHHAALTFDGTTMRIYLDGSLDTSLATTNTPRITTVQPASLGSSLSTTGSLNGAFQGFLDEARIYDGALLATDIADLATVPEPMAGLLMVIGMIGLAGRSRRARK